MSDMAERTPKKLRSSEPDLQIILGTGDDVSTQWHHSSLLAAKSKYIDTMLSTQMREQASRTITFPDISPAVWEKMNTFLDDPLAARKMKPEDVRDIALFYDKYEFTLGCKLCEEVIVEYFDSESLRKMENSYTLDLELIIDLTSVAHEANFKSAFKTGLDYLLNKLADSDYGRLRQYGRCMFTEKHLKRVFPMIKDTSLPNTHIGILKSLLDGEDESLEELVNRPNIEKEFINTCKDLRHQHLLYHAISHLVVSGADPADGKYETHGFNMGFYHAGGNDNRVTAWSNQRVKFKIHYTSRGEEDGWAIVRYVPPPPTTDSDEEDPEYEYKICWWAQYSKNMCLPPISGWVPHDPLAHRNPTIKYILRKSIG